MDKKEFGRRLQIARKERGQTGEQLAELAPLCSLYQRATPTQLRMITAMMQGALAAMDETLPPDDA